MALPPPEEDAKNFSKEYHDTHAELLREVAQVPPVGGQKDIVAGRYAIRLTEPLPEFDTQLAKAYAAQDEKDPTRTLYALICSTKMPARGKLVKMLEGVSIPHLVALVANGMAELNAPMAGRRYVLIYERPKGKSLATIMAERGKPFPENFIIEQIMAPLASALGYCTEMGFSHGRVNPSNIFFGDTVTLGECLADPCGYSQPYFYETPERAQASPAGKGEGTPAQDYFALGVLGAFLRVGQRVFDASPSQEAHVLRLLSHGAYAAFSQNIEFSDGMTDLLRGTLNENVHERWTNQQVKLLAGGRRFNMLPPNVHSTASRPFVIEKREYFNLRDMAQGIFQHWDIASGMLRDGSIIRWVDLSARRKDLAEILQRTVQSLGGTMARNAQHNDELVARTIVILDLAAPLSAKDVRAHIDGIGALLAEAFRTGTQQHIQHLAELLEHGLAAIWGDMHKRSDELMSGDTANALWQIDRLRPVLRMKGMGFGIERCMYDLAPDAPCASPLLEGYHAHTLKDLLIALNAIAADKARAGQQLLDRHIAAFIANKLSITRENLVPEFEHAPKLARHPGIIALMLLERAQENAGRPRLPALSLWVALEVLSAVESYHSKSLRHELHSGIRRSAANGYLGQLQEFIAEKRLLKSDISGYSQAIDSYRLMTQKVVILKSKPHTMLRATLTGYSVAKYISYAIFTTVAVYMTRGHIF